MKKIFAFLLCSALCVGLAACGEPEEVYLDSDPLEGVTLTEAFDGRWSDGNGTVLSLDSAGRNYLLKTPAGRCGRGSYTPMEEAPTLSFDGDTYAIISSGDSFVLQCTGDVSGTESLDGVSFDRDDPAELNYYTVSALDGTWSNDAGVKLSAFAEVGQFEVISGVSGILSDEGNGKGPYLKSGDIKVYVAVSADKSSFTVLNGESIGLSGIFRRELTVPGKNDGETLAQYAHYYDTWYQYAAKSRASITLRADGTWEAHNRYNALTGEGTFYVTDEGTLALYDSARKYMGSVSLDEKDRLYYTAEREDHENEQPYSRAAVSH